VILEAYSKCDRRLFVVRTFERVDPMITSPRHIYERDEALARDLSLHTIAKETSEVTKCYLFGRHLQNA